MKLGDDILFYEDTPKCRQVKCGEYVTMGNSSVALGSLAISVEGSGDVSYAKTER